MSSHFHARLLRQVAIGLQSHQSNNFDYLRYPLPMRQRSATHFLEGFARAKLYRHTRAVSSMVDQRMAEMEPHFEGLAWFYQRLADEKSKQTLVEVLAYRLLGPRHIRISAVQEAFWKAVPLVSGDMVVKKRSQKVGMLDGWLDDFELTNYGYPVRLRAHRLNVLNTFLLEQYRFVAPGIEVEAKPGDVVVDGGGCWGDTALYFAQKVGATGQVHVFEFSPENIELMQFNLSKNPELAPRIHLQQAAVWNRSDETLRFAEAGPGTSLGAGGLKAGTLSIDDWATRENIVKVDFIKLDIEGAEAQALEGASRVIQQHRPTLAVALYHDLADFTKLPQQIDAINLGYRFYLGHYTIHSEETILFAVKP